MWVVNASSGSSCVDMDGFLPPTTTYYPPPCLPPTTTHHLLTTAASSPVICIAGLALPARRRCSGPLKV